MTTLPGPNVFTDLSEEELTPLQLRAIDNFVKDPSNKAKAMRDAGYKQGSINQASTFFKNPRILSEINRRRQMAANKSGITPESVRLRLVEAYDNAMANGQFSAAIRAAELMGKDVGMFEAKSSQTIRIEGAVAHGASGELSRLLGIAKNAGIVEGEFQVVDRAQIEDLSNGED